MELLLFMNISITNSVTNTLTDFPSTSTNLASLPVLKFYKKGFNLYRPLLKFSLPQILNAATIHLAELNLYRTKGLPPNGPLEIETHIVTTPWDINSTWIKATNSTNWNIPGGDFDSEIISQLMITNFTYPQWMVIDVTQALQEWIIGSKQNYGVAIIVAGENTEFDFASAAFGTIGLRPQLIVEFTPPAEIQIGQP